MSNEARLALEAIETTLRRLGADPGVSDWIARIKAARERQLNDGDLDQRVARLAQQIGIGPLRAPEFRRRFRMGWQQQARLCPATEISSTLDRAITSDLLQHGANQHPLVPAEVMAHLNLGQGPLIGEAMKLARELHNSTPCTKAELLERLGEILADRSTT